MEDFTIKKEDKYTLLKVNIEKLDSRLSPTLKSELVMLNANSEKNIIMDLSDCHYCDSSGLSSILIGNRLCNNVNGTFVLTGLNEPVKKLVSISQLDTILNITPTLDEAVQFLYLEEIEKDMGDKEERS